MSKGRNGASSSKPKVSSNVSSLSNGSTSSHSHSTSTSTSTQPKLYEVHVSKRFLLTSAVISILLSYFTGKACRHIVFHMDQSHTQSHSHAHTQSQIGNGNGIPEQNFGKELPEASLPNPRLMDGKIAPHTLYTAKNFDTAATATTSSVHLQQNVKKNCNTDEGGVCNDPNAANADAANADTKIPNDNNDNNNNETHNNNNTDNDNDDEELHLPAGQHLLVDIKNVDPTFLNSESRLAHAMIDVVSLSRLTLLSYHCHSLQPHGVSCVGVLLESHVSFHTWPEEGVITLDLFTCGSGELVPVLPLIEENFAIHVQLYNSTTHQHEKDDRYDDPVVVWSHKLRGFRPDAARDSSVWSNDLGKMVVEVSHLSMKQEVASTQTMFQRIHIYDIVDGTKRSSSMKTTTMTTTSHEEEEEEESVRYENLHPELYQPDRIVFLEGVLQSTRLGNEAYHEALVQPAMMAHENPKRVGIIGGGEGATLREVLKHVSLETVIMIEIDEEMVSFSREYLPDWSDCSDFIVNGGGKSGNEEKSGDGGGGSVDWCGDDARADLRYEDGAAWFKNRFTDERIDEEGYREDPFDVLIMDALDPQDDIPFADLLYTNLPFLKALYDSLSHDGIIVMQLGGAPYIDSPPENVALNAKRGQLTQILSKAGFVSIHIFEEAHCGFHAPWSFLVAMKSEISRKRWYRVSSEVDIDIHERIIRTKSGQPALKHFDGAMMASYQVPSKAFESVYCKATPTPESCVRNEGIRSQSVRRMRDNKFDMYLDRHTYEKEVNLDSTTRDGESNTNANMNANEITNINILCDYFYYNEQRLKRNSAIDYENIRKQCEN